MTSPETAQSDETTSALLGLAQSVGDRFWSDDGSQYAKPSDALADALAAVDEATGEAIAAAVSAEFSATEDQPLALEGTAAVTAYFSSSTNRGKFDDFFEAAFWRLANAQGLDSAVLIMSELNEEIRRREAAAIARLGRQR